MAKALNHMSKPCKGGQLDDLLNQAGPISRDNAYHMLQECTRKKDLELAKSLQPLIVQSGLDSVAVLGDHIIRLFSSGGCLLESNQAFQKVMEPSVYSWSAIISAHSNLEHSDTALELYTRMQLSCVKCDRYVYLAVLKSCIATLDFRQGKSMHSQIILTALQLDVSLGSMLINMYAKCGNLAESRKVFDALLYQNVISWGAMIAGYAQNDEGLLALDCFEEMQTKGMEPDNVIFSSILKACGSIENLERGRAIHEHILEFDLSSDVVVGNSLIDLYARCGSLQESQKVFDNLPNRDVVSWNAFIAGCVQHGKNLFAMNCFDKMQKEGIKPNKITFFSIMKVCGRLCDRDLGKAIHDEILKHDYKYDVAVGCTLVDMYSKCGMLDNSLIIFNNLPTRDVVSWNALIAGYAQRNEVFLAIDCFERMKQEGIMPNKVTILNVFKGCSTGEVIGWVRLIHSWILNHLLDLDEVIGSLLIDTYAKCCGLEESQRVFANVLNRDVVSWGAMIAGYTQHGKSLLALNCYEQMQEAGIDPDAVIFSSILKACGTAEALTQGRAIHDQIMTHRLKRDIAVGNSIIDMYVKCGSLEESHKIFETLPNRDVISWNILIAGYAQHDESFLSLCCFEMMQECINPNKVTFLSSLRACGNIGAVIHGRLIHNRILEQELQTDIVIGNTLINMYAKCGSLNESYDVFCMLPYRNTVSWNALLAGYAQHGKSFLAMECFDNMQDEGIISDKVTFLCLLIACNHVGLVDGGHWYFGHMAKCYGLFPDEDHFLSMVDLLGRAGCLEEAKALLQATDQPSLLGWKSLLSACRNHGNVELGRECFHKLSYLDPRCVPGYVLMSNIYADAKKQAGNRDEEMEETSDWHMLSGLTWNEVDMKVHPDNYGELDVMLDSITERLENEEHIPS